MIEMTWMQSSMSIRSCSLDHFYRTSECDELRSCERVQTFDLHPHKKLSQANVAGVWEEAVTN